MYWIPDKSDYIKAREKGISYACLYMRSYVGWSYERAMNTPVQAAKVDWKPYIEIAKQNGIPYATMVKRFNKGGWTPEEASTIPLVSRTKGERVLIHKKKKKSK